MSTDSSPIASPTRRPRASVLAAVVATFVFALAIFVASPASTAGAQATPEITSDGVGDAVVGSTRAQLEAQLGPSYTFGPLEVVLVDVEGYEVRRDGVVQFIAATTTPVSPDSALNLFIVRTPGLTTADGIGVGSTMAEGVDAYGAVTISFSTDNESREFAKFERQPEGLIFRTGSGATAGIYPGSDGSNSRTNEFIADAEITAVWVSCRASIGNCPPQPELPYTGRTQTLLLFTSAALATVGFVLVYAENRLAKRNTASH